jgi:ABC-type transport system substrate-binding protein/cyclophilin family peptidyl-prolyl cis-trans isomerase/serine/threonine protein kinase
MGYVYLAKDKNLFDRLCVVKQVRDRLQSKEHQEKLEEEALRMAKLNHPNVAMILDHFVETGYYFLVVEHIRGKTLSEVFEENNGPLEENEVLQWAKTICDVLVYLHNEGVIHRDISPDNIMLTSDGAIKFIDFGTLRELRKVASGGTAGMGKFGFSPPEQWQGKPEPRSDIFALGATLYFLLTGFLPLSSEYQSGQGSQRTDFYPNFPPIRKKNPVISGQFESVLQKALYLEISTRYATASDMLRDLNKIILPTKKRVSKTLKRAGKSSKWRTYAIAAFAFLAVIVLGSSIYYFVIRKGSVPANPSNLAVIKASYDQISLVWDDNSEDETAFRLERAGDVNFIDNLTVFNLPSNATTYIDKSITTSTTYFYRISAINSGAKSTHSNVVKTVAPIPTGVPGTLWAWGKNNDGQLGDGTTTDRTMPVQVINLTDVVAVAGGGSMHCLALKSDGTIWEWGNNPATFVQNKTPLQVEDINQVVKIAGDTHQSLALKSDGSVWAWGDNWTGMLGNGTYDRSAVPVKVQGLDHVVDIDAGIVFSLALKSDGSVWAWGVNDRGQLGSEILPKSNFPVQVSGLNDIIAIDAGGYHGLALKSDGTVWAWGWNRYGQLGNEASEYSPNAVQVMGIRDAIAVSAGTYNSLALKSDGSVWSIGKSITQVTGIDMIVAIESGENHNLALRSDGSVWAWGSNSGDSTNPTQITGLNRVDYISIGNLSNYAIEITANVISNPTTTLSITKTPIPGSPVDLKSIAYIYLTDVMRRDQFKSFLESRGYTVDTISVQALPQMGLSSYGLIIVGSDTGAEYTWGTTDSVSAIKNSGRPIIGIHFGGLALFNKLDLSMREYWVASDTGLYIEDPTHIIFNKPYQISIPENQILDLGYMDSFIAGYAPLLPSSVKLLARQANDTQHYIIMQEGSNLLYGFNFDPSLAKEAGLNLFLNTVDYLITSSPTTTLSPTVSTTSPPNAVSFIVDKSPFGICFDGTNIWVATYFNSKIFKLRASDGAILGTYRVSHIDGDICFDGTNIWVASASANNVIKLSANDGTVLGTYSVGNQPSDICFDGTNIWVTNYGSNNVTKLRASDGMILGTYAVGTNPLGICSDGFNIWVANRGSSSVTKLKASDGYIQGSYSVGLDPAFVCYDGTNIWVTNFSSGSITKLKASDGTIQGNYTVGNGPLGVGYDGNNIWVANYEGGDNSVTKLRVSDGAILGSYAVGQEPAGICFDGNNIWVTNNGSDSVTKLIIKPEIIPTKYPTTTPTITTTPVITTIPMIYPTTTVPTTGTTTAPPPMTIDQNREYTANINTNYGDIVIRLLPKEAPIAVNNFVYLARSGFYNGVIFHRIIKNFIIQSGDPAGTGSGGPGYKFADEPITRNYIKGTLAMANTGPNTNGSQFFITLADLPGLVKSYTIFGLVISGMDVVDKIGAVPTTTVYAENSYPTVDVHINTIIITETWTPTPSPTIPTIYPTTTAPITTTIVPTTYPTTSSPTITTVPTTVPTTSHSNRITLRGTADIVSFDPYSGPKTNINSAWMERLYTDDWALEPTIFDYKTDFRPHEYVKGQLAESWEFTDPGTLVVHIRKGVQWQVLTPLNGREFTANDVAYHYHRLFGGGDGFISPAPYWGTVASYQYLTSVTAIDTYTIAFKWSIYNPEFILDTMQGLGIEHCIVAREVVEKSGGVINSWSNSVGTGPFILQNFISGSSVTLIKNTNYWAYDERNAQNKLPYIDELRYLIIPDKATAIAALRTGKIEAMDEISWQDAQNIQTTNPDILRVTDSVLNTLTIDPRNDKIPLNDIRVRKAMQMAIDLSAIATIYYGGSAEPYPSTLTAKELTGWGWSYDQWPQDLKNEYAYNLSTAKQRLAEAGYPNGFKTNVVAPLNADINLLNMVKSYFAQIGIDLEIRTYNATTWNTMVMARNHDQLVFSTTGSLGLTSSPIEQFMQFMTGQASNWLMVNDPVYNDFYSNALIATSEVQWKQLVRDANEYVARQHFSISLIKPKTFALYQSWLHGYNGQNNAISGNYGPNLLGYYAARFRIY